eukprot:COSAG06_NODE_34117_length_479_cov_1.007895_1_plen_46_part_10
MQHSWRLPLATCTRRPLIGKGSRNWRRLCRRHTTVLQLSLSVLSEL